MKPKFRVRIDGIADFEERLRKMSLEVRWEIIEEAMLAAGEIVRNDAAGRTPFRTGRLRGGLRVELGSKKKPSVRVGTGREVFYGRFIELGARESTPRPFLLPAVESQKENVRRAIIEVFRRRLGIV